DRRIRKKSNEIEDLVIRVQGISLTCLKTEGNREIYHLVFFFSLRFHCGLETKFQPETEFSLKGNERGEEKMSYQHIAHESYQQQSGKLNPTISPFSPFGLIVMFD
ncbi:unnamed protein product, partial [Linum tenue]